MRTLSFPVLAGILLAPCCPFLSHGAWVVDERKTELQASTQWGFVGGIQTDHYRLERTSPTTDLQTVLSAVRSGDGALGDGSWIANYEFRLDQQIELRPDGTFTASGSMDLFAFAGDQGISVIDARPGNRLELGFTVSIPESIVFAGQTTDWASVSLEQNVGGIDWIPVVGPSSGTVRSQLTLQPGRYRLLAESQGYHDGSTGSGSAWTVEVTTVPEPSGLLLVGAAVLAGAGWRRYHRRS